jgi:undecaprenyl-phosphate galactose phosphotransferase
MSVVNRIPRSFPFSADAGVRSFPPATQERLSRLPMPNACSAWCAAGIIASDTLAFAATLALAFALLPLLPGNWAASGPGTPIHDAMLWIICLYAGLIGYFASHAHYDHRCDVWTELRDVGMASVVAMVLTGWCAYMLGAALPRPLLVAGAGLLPLLVVPFRIAAKFLLDRAGVWRVPVVIVGTGSWGATAAEALQTAHRLGYAVVAQIGPAAVMSGMGPSPWAQLLVQHGARMVVLAFDPDHRPPVGLTASLVRERVAFAVMPHLDGLPVAGCRQTHLASQDAVLQSYKNNLDKPVARSTKIAFDLVVAAIALVILAPVLVLIAAAVSLDGGPVLYGHTRIGARGRVFKCLKFRSMVVDSDAVLKRLLAEDAQAAEEWARTQKLRHDPRVTWIGRILRKTSLDELPQLLNVMRLEMSLVGPRPIVSLEIPKYAEDIAYYYETRPGITGLWQVSGRSDTTYAQRVRLDSWYAKNWTIWQDLAILFRTLPAVVSGRGAG